MDKKIEKNWKAIEDIEQKVRTKTGDPEAGFNANRLWFGKDGRHLLIPCLYRGKKGKKGEKVFTKSRKQMMVTAYYCPFTGKPLYIEED